MHLHVSAACRLLHSVVADDVDVVFQKVSAKIKAAMFD